MVVNNLRERLTTIALLAALITLMPTDAHAQQLFDTGTTFLNNLMDLLTNTWARIVAIIAVVILGFSAMASRLSWRNAGAVMVGIILVFGAAAIVDSIESSI